MFFFPIQHFTRCLTIDGTRLQIERAEAASRIVIEIEDEDIETEDHTHRPPVVTESATDGGEGTDRREAICARGGTGRCDVSL